MVTKEIFYFQSAELYFTQETNLVGCILSNCAKSNQMSVPWASPSEQVQTDLQSWPQDVTIGGRVLSIGSRGPVATWDPCGQNDRET